MLLAVREFRQRLLDEADLLVIPVAGSAAGNFNSFFRTATQIHNPTGSELSVKVLFHPQGQSGSDSDPSTTITLQPHETRFFADIVASIERDGPLVTLIAVAGLIIMVVLLVGFTRRALAVLVGTGGAESATWAWKLSNVGQAVEPP